MSKLDDLIQKYCPNGVEYKEVKDVCNISKGVQFNKRDMNKIGTFPVINGGILPSGYIERYNQEKNTITISQGGASAGYVNWQNQKFWAGAHCYSVKALSNIVDRYLYHFLKMKEYILQRCQHGAGIPSLSKSIIENLLIPVPPLPVQEEIAHILDSFTKFNEELNQELIIRKKQYEYYRDKLLNFNNNIPQIKLKNCILETKNIKTNDILNKLYIDLSSVDRLDHKIKDTSIINFDNAPSRAKQIVYKDDILFATTRPMLKRYCIVNEAFDNQICSTGFCILRADKNKVLPKWIYYSIGTTSFFEFIQLYQKGSSYPAITNTDVKEYKIFLPSLDKQKFIISILDKFDTLCNDLSIGLPAEIEARKKQYEYYRDKLLTFKELKQ